MQELNAALQALHASGQVKVVSAIEGKPTETPLGGLLPKVVVVPPDTA